MGRRLQVQDDRVVGVAHLARQRPARPHLPRQRVVRARRDRVAQAVEAPVGAGLRAVLVELQRRAGRPRRWDEARGLAHVRRRDVVRRPALVVAAPAAPVAVAGDVLVEGVVRGVALDLVGHAAAASPRPSAVFSGPLRPSISRASAGVAMSSDSSPQDAPDLLDLLGVALRQAPLLEVDRVLEADADVAAHDRPDGHEPRLVAARPEHGQLVVVAEQAVGDPLHVHQVLDVRADAAEDPEDRLHEQRRLDQPAVHEVGEVVEVAGVVALELEAGAARADLAHDRLDVGERVLEDEVARHLEVRLLPVVLELRDPGGHREDPEVEAAHVQGAQLGVEPPHGGEPLVERHPQAAAGRDVDDRVGAVEDARQELAEHRRGRGSGGRSRGRGRADAGSRRRPRPRRPPGRRSPRE